MRVWMIVGVGVVAVGWLGRASGGGGRGRGVAGSERSSRGHEQGTGDTFICGEEKRSRVLESVVRVCLWMWEGGGESEGESGMVVVVVVVVVVWLGIPGRS